MVAAPLHDRLDGLIAAHARRRPVGPTPAWRELGIDSLGLLSLIVACEDELSVEVPDRVLSRMRGPDDLRAWLAERLGVQPS